MKLTLKGSYLPPKAEASLPLYIKNEKTQLSNWRPISLLNTDYKLLAHILANRLKTVIDKLISPDQTGYIQGKFLGQNIRVIQDIIDMIEEENTEAALLFLDFKKAFDTVNHDFLFKTLERYKFGNSFTNWVKIMYNKAESCVTNNGWVSKPLKKKCGIRRGCPLSALLFLLVVEILALKTKEEKGDGLEFINSDGSKEYLHITQLADDATLILRNENAVINTLQKVKYFGKISGLEINMNKTEGMWLGHGKNRNDNFAGINWQKDMVKALGVWFGYNKTETETRNWQSKLESIKDTLNTWSCRDLTFQGRVLIIKTLALSKIVY